MGSQIAECGLLELSRGCKAKVSCEVSVNVFAHVSLVFSDDKQTEGDTTGPTDVGLRMGCVEHVGWLGL